MGQSDNSSKRCAIYSRKSSEEGLGQNFNSLQAQRQACEAFVRSQAGEGWRPVKIAYDDGGFSGATMDRPALKALLAHIREKRIDVVVVYKVDRLTRSLADFSKIVEIFDAQGVSFVAVTQQFNTTTSMGRLTLNVLLSFAQFEREVTGERIRDKIAASKQKGMWMGGTVPLGYDVRDRRLVVNAKESRACRPSAPQPHRRPRSAPQGGTGRWSAVEFRISIYRRGFQEPEVKELHVEDAVEQCGLAGAKKASDGYSSPSDRWFSFDHVDTWGRQA